MTRRLITEVSVASEKIAGPLTLAVVSDLHNGEYQDVLPALAHVDAILIVGDLVDRHRNRYDGALRFLNDAPELAPTFYAIGNHERKLPSLDDYWPHVENSGVTVLDNRFTDFRGILLGGLSSAEEDQVQTDFLARAMGDPAFKLLMCHHPEYFRPYVEPYDIDLTVAGHAHGGQVQIAGRGLYSPNQGLLPRLTSGYYENGRLLVSRGMTNATWMPRLNNPCELIMLRLTGRTSDEAK